jgi:hypothetical protein
MPAVLVTFFLASFLGGAHIRRAECPNYQALLVVDCGPSSFGSPIAATLSVTSEELTIFTTASLSFSAMSVASFHALRRARLLVRVNGMAGILR